MTEELKQRLNDLKTELHLADEGARGALLERLDQIVIMMQDDGTPVPGWARRQLAEREAAQAEDMFDNMPL